MGVIVKKDLSKYTLLVVDDDDSIRELVSALFEMRGFNILNAYNAPSALEVLKKNKVELVLSDIRMPGGDGISLLEQIRQCSPDIPVVILFTGFSDLTEKQCIAKGAKKVFTKPFDHRELMNFVIASLPNHSLA